MFPTYFLQNLQRYLSAIHDFIFALKKFSDFALLISLGINSHIFGAREDTHKKTFGTQEVPTRKNFRSTKCPREKVLNPRRHNSAMARDP